MHRALECINKKFIKRSVLTNSHKFLTCIKMSLYGIVLLIANDFSCTFALFLLLVIKSKLKLDGLLYI